MQVSLRGLGDVACTMDAAICPDGSIVGRVGPDCHFAPCPTSSLIPLPAGAYPPAVTPGATNYLKFAGMCFTTKPSELGWGAGGCMAVYAVVGIAALLIFGLFGGKR